MESETRGMQAEQVASRFIAQRETGPWSQEDAAEFARWLSASTLNRVAYYRLNAAWKEAGRLKVLPAAEADCPRTPKRFPLALVAGFVLAVVTPLFFFRENLFDRHRYSTEVGGLEAVQMEDGSRVMLNTNSVLRVYLTGKERRVVLDRGEAFFDVAKDPSRPFVVHIGDKRVVAVGTRFSVRRDADEVHVTVTDGAVRMELLNGGKPGDKPWSPVAGPAQAGGAKQVLLPAGSVARANAAGILVEEHPVQDVEQRLTWRSGVLTFHRTPLSEAVDEINRYNTRQIVIRDPSVAAIRVGGIFEATKIDPFLRLLESGFPIRVSQEGSRIVIAAK